MPSIRDSRTVAAGVTVVNLLSGSKFEFMPVPAAVLVYAMHDAGGPVLMDVTFGNVVEGDALVVPSTGTAGAGPFLDADLLASGVAAAGDRLQIKVTNTHATTTANLRTVVQIRPL